MGKKEENARERCKIFLGADLERDLGEKVDKEKVDEIWSEKYEELFKRFYSERITTWRLYVALRDESHFR